MARYKHYDYGQTKLLAVNYEKQIMPGTLEWGLNYFIEKRLDRSVFEARYRNDATGAPAYNPAILLKIILYAYSKGITSSRDIEQLCRENVMFMALSCDTVPHFTTLADFISSLREEVKTIFRDVLLACDEAKLIGREMFAVDGVKLPTNAAKHWSGAKKDFAKKVAKMDKAIAYLTARHRRCDEEEANPPTDPGSKDRHAAEQKQMETLTAISEKMKRWMQENNDKIGASGKAKKSNLTDNDSATIKTSKGVIQGYDAVAVVDGKHQIVVHAKAFGEAQEHHLLQPMCEGTKDQFQKLGDENILEQTKLTADAGFHTEANMKYLFENHIDAYVADTFMRKRDPRFIEADRYKPAKPEPTQFRPADFIFDPKTHTCVCPAGKNLYGNGTNCKTSGYTATRFRGAKQDCLPCHLRQKCLRDPSKTQVRQVSFFSKQSTRNPYTQQMKQRIDSEEGRYYYSKRMSIVEPVFAHIRHSMGLNRFSLRGKVKVNTQWLLYCIVHNLTKLCRYGNLAALKH